MRILFQYCFFLMLASLLSCSPSAREDKAKNREIRQARHDATLKELAELHNAVTEKDAIPSSDESIPFTYEIQQGLSKSESRPLLIDGMIDDITIRNDTASMDIQESFGGTYSIFRLTINSNMLARIKASGVKRFDSIAVVARITSVEKPAFEVRPSGEDLDMTIGNTYVIAGECLDFRSVP